MSRPEPGADQAARDLAWIVNGPSLIRAPQVVHREPLPVDAVDTDALERFLAARMQRADGRPERRVGRYFEHLVHFWLAQIRGVQVEGVGVPLRAGGRTIGELDFVYIDEAGARVHCEVAVKFFLHLRRDSGSNYPGPNPSDSFERKMTRLFEHQLPISREYGDPIDRREVFVSGMIFRADDDAEPADRPELLAPDHAGGRWMRAGELRPPAGPGRLAEAGAVSGATAEKPFWLAPQVDVALLELAALVDHLDAHFTSGRAHPVMVSLRDGGGNEVERLFVVSDRWPKPPGR